METESHINLGRDLESTFSFPEIHHLTKHKSRYAQAQMIQPVASTAGWNKNKHASGGIMKSESVQQNVVISTT